MRKFWFAILLSSSFLLAQDNSAKQDTTNAKGEVTMTGCVSRSNGDYTLMKEDPSITYELQGSHGVKLHHYLGKRVEVTGTKSPTMASSSDAMNKVGSAAPVTITVTSIKTLDKDCSARDVSR
jgi:hypothetical protein